MIDIAFKLFCHAGLRKIEKAANWKGGLRVRVGFCRQDGPGANPVSLPSLNENLLGVLCLLKRVYGSFARLVVPKLLQIAHFVREVSHQNLKF